MAVLLVLATFLVFLLIDWILNRKKAVIVQNEPIQTEAPALLSSASVEGILVPDQLRYHPGHTWCVAERPQFVRVGADALAGSVISSPDRIELPKPGRWLRQGQRAWSVYCGNQRIDMVSPVEGEVMEVNPDVANRPELVCSDPYGSGWLLKVAVPDAQSTERNLLPKSLVRAWMKEAVQSVRSRQRTVGNVMVVGRGRVAVSVDGTTLPALAKELFLV
jgi:glycine cleavage system H protein